MKTIKIATDYSETPLGRYQEDGDYNGARFREEFLRPALQNEDQVEVDIDDVEGYGSSFLDEAFGGLVREGYFNAGDLQKRLKIKCTDPDYTIYRDLIWKYVREAKPTKAV
jgi:STAS-like domain of unknown function (DUF4325)